MKKIGDVTSTADKNGEWTNGNVAAGIAPTILDAAWLNSVQREILGVIIAAGLQQDKNDDIQLSKAISKIISGGNYATAEDLKKYLAKDQNGADIPNKDTFIKNLGLEERLNKKVDYANHTITGGVDSAGRGSVNTANGALRLYREADGSVFILSRKDADSESDYETNAKFQKGSGIVAFIADVKAIEIPVGALSYFMQHHTNLPEKWYSLNGDKFSITSPQGIAIKSLPASTKSDWGIVESGGMINLPQIWQPDGRVPFLRPVNGTGRRPGNVDGDKIRNITGTNIRVLQAGAVNNPGGAFRYSADNSITGVGSGTVQLFKVDFNAGDVVPTGSENKPLDIGVSVAVYLGV
ncbi:hypothetical protein [Morganella morganii]|uniref:hypothetical protein n=1 Tax=Morganella morganii TaxID=582 RepID=UPI0032DAC189